VARLPSLSRLTKTPQQKIPPPYSRGVLGEGRDRSEVPRKRCSCESGTSTKAGAPIGNIRAANANTPPSRPTRGIPAPPVRNAAGQMHIAFAIVYPQREKGKCIGQKKESCRNYQCRSATPSSESLEAPPQIPIYA
jgi:hypothetical protein